MLRAVVVRLAQAVPGPLLADRGPGIALALMEATLTAMPQHASQSWHPWPNRDPVEISVVHYPGVRLPAWGSAVVVPVELLKRPERRVDPVEGGVEIAAASSIPLIRRLLGDESREGRTPPRGRRGRSSQLHGEPHRRSARIRRRATSSGSPADRRG